MKLSAFTRSYAQISPRKGHLALPLAIMALLFFASSVPGTPVPAEPGAYAMFRWLPPDIQNALHIPAYAALSAAWRWSLAAWLRAPLALASAACILATVYGVLDEWHQSFVVGRYASLSDVGFDVVGALIGAWLIAQITRAGERRSTGLTA